MMDSLIGNSTTNGTEIHHSDVSSTGFYLPTWSVNVIIVVNIVIMVLAVTGNGVILIVEQFNKQKTSTDWMVTFMSANDLLLAGWNTPIYILTYGGSWQSIGNDALCGVMFYVQETLSYSSTLLLTLTALDRYIKTCHPLKEGITPTRAKCICTGITIFAMLVSAPIPVYIKYDVSRNCKYIFPDSSVTTLFNVMMMVIQASFVAMFIVVIVCYCKIAVTIRGRKRRMNEPHVSLQTQAKPPPRGRTAIFTVLANLKSKTSKVAPLSASRDVHMTTELGMAATTSTLVIQDDTLAQQYNNEGSIPVINNTNRGTSMGNATPHNTRSAKERQINKTTAIMFAVTVVFILSWVPAWVQAAIWPYQAMENATERVISVFLRRSFIINTCTNPLFYIGMSSTFRKLTRETMRKIWQRVQRLIGA